jgi:hypothetical protein
MRDGDARLADALEASSERAYGDAGPPNRALFVALGVGLLAALAVSTAAPMVDAWLLIGGGVGGMTALVALTDREGWRTRQGMAYLATEQLTRWPDRPTSASEARDWLADPRNDGAPLLRRGAVQTHAGDLEAAEATIASFEPDSEIDLVRKSAAAIVLEGRRSGSIDIVAIRSLSTAMTAEEANYQIAAAAWTQACLDVGNRRPWRKRFATEIASLGPVELPRAIRAEIAVRQLAAPITATISSILVALIS